MQVRRFIYSVLLAGMLGVPAYAQSPLGADSTLSWSTFLTWVDANHPVLKSVQAQLPQAKAELLRARGAFDPTLSGQFASKEFKGTLYYRMPSWELTTQTAGPVELSVDWNATAGQYTNPQDFLPEEGLFAVGGMINLGNGLLTDQRRTDLALARAGVRLTEAQAELYRNEVLLKASKDYWKWYSAYEKLKAYEAAIAAALEVYTFTLDAFAAGDASAMDTLDARALLTTWRTDYYQARTSAIEALYRASNWLWDADEQPVVLRPGISPTFDQERVMYANELASDHPLRAYNDNKERQLLLKRRLAREYLKPKVAVGGAVLLPGNFEQLPGQSDWDVENRVLKAKVNMPLFMREGLGYSRSQSIELQQFQWERAAAENDWNNALAATAQSIIQLEEALAASRDNQRTLEALLTGEQQKLRFGDSELIKVNLRTSYYAKALITTATLEAELGMKRAEWTQLSAGF